MDYLDEILWFASWPIVVYFSYRFVLFNLKNYSKRKNRT